MQDGRVIVEGGEYNQYGAGFTKLGAIYDPVANAWTSVTAPSGWGNIGDASTAVLSNGTLMLANTVTKQASLLNASNLTWTATGNSKFDINDEEGWDLLPGGKVLTVDAYVHQYNANGMNYELYDPIAGTWTVAGTTPVQLWDSCGGVGGASYEVGPAVLMPNGTVYATGANGCGAGHTAVYHISSGTWTAGPDFPGTYDIADGPAALETNGKVLMLASPGIFGSGAAFFEWDGSNLAQTDAPPNAPNVSSFQGHLMMLPTGQIMYTDYTNDVELYTSDRQQLHGLECHGPAEPDHFCTAAPPSYSLGSKFNGASQNNDYGDDYQTATNYPIVRFVNVATGHVFYGRTHDHEGMQVGYVGPTYTHLDFPATMETGFTNMQIVVNGIPSQNYLINIQ